MPSAGEAYRQLAPAVLGYLRAQRAPDPEDLLGEVFVQVARDLPRFSGDDAALRRWVFAIAHNRLLDARRRAERRPQIASTAVPDRAAPPAVDNLDPTLVRALGTLTADQREVLVLRFVADLALEDVARITHRRAGAVKALQHRALEALARALGPT
ncbi:MAG TPA: sigma-70 family RNA polymerase sigma factor [Acidimicrobiales bacterium]|nr:sigma-70 family RNA polymerase sigma factor [Acidimicrobiales bacterium]